MAQTHSVSMPGGTSSRRHGHHNHSHETGSLSMPSGRHGDTEWEAKEAHRQRELEEARARAAQMEKTMRWWSDCTANWREKWSKVRNERNSAREESKMLRSKLEMAIKDRNSFKREKLELETQNDRLKRELEKIHLLLLKHDDQTLLVEALAHEDPERDLTVQKPARLTGSSPVSSSSLPSPKAASINSRSPTACNGNGGESDSSRKSTADLHNKMCRELNIEEYVLQGAVPRHAVEMYYSSGKENALDAEENADSLLCPRGGLESPDAAATEDGKALRSHSPNAVDTLGSHYDVGSGSSVGGEPGEERGRRGRVGDHNRSVSACSSSPDREILIQRLMSKLEEATKTIQTLNEEKLTRRNTIERLEAELLELKVRCEDLWQERQKAVRDLLQLESLQEDEVRHIRAELQDEASSREGMDRRLADLRSELERLQAENAVEWGKRERLETEKLGLERDNKKLKAELKDVQERLAERRAKPTSASSDAELRQCQQELADRTKELSSLKHSQNKLKKIIQEKATELAHAARRAEQYEAEVKRLRGRVEELKRDLAIAEDEVDVASNNIRKLQRTNDELQEQVESLQVQLDHTQTRLRNSTSSSHLSIRNPKHLLEQGSDDDDDDDDDDDLNLY
ncbi:coiled-coil domain-containing protein 102A isoform X2 [Thrips palmi]|uniref:Coiled-coil domain-containing protein 102A n=1 Tax=Thrips palmi TaxID=161013 RepID=A0A6P8Y8W8_THRPL|nr:coiled-coil domain-containing protein 102A isoform X2 [Thrips palmi]